MGDYLDSLLDAQAAKAPAAGGDFLDALLDKRANEKPFSASVNSYSDKPGPGLAQYADPKTGRTYYAKPADVQQPDGTASPAGVIAGKVVKAFTYPFRKAASGYRGLYDMAADMAGGIDPKTAADTATGDIQAGQQFQEPTPSGPAAAATDRALSSPFNPLNWPALVARDTAEHYEAAAQQLGAAPEATHAVIEGAGDISTLFGLRSSMRAGGTAAAADEGAWDAPFQPKPKDHAGVQEALNQQYAGQSMGAAATAPNLLNVSPALRDKVTGLVENGGAINKEALARHAEAESLPVPARLSRGQALQDQGLLSDEFNAKGRHQEIRDLFTDQNNNRIENVRTIREQVGPDVFTTNHVEHGETLIDAYKAKDAAVKADISAKYQALKDANGGEFPVNGQAFVASADAALKDANRAHFVPGEVRSLMNDFRDGKPMTFNDFETMRTILAEQGRKAARAGDGTAEHAISVIRQSLEDLPMTGGTPQIKMLADQARQAAKSRFDALRADPAYKAAVDDSVPADRFVQKYVVGGTKEGVGAMRKALSGDATALQTMSVAALDHLRKQAGINSEYSGNFSQSGFNKALEGLSPKLQSLVPPKAAEQLESLGRVARWQQEMGSGNYANRSHTFVAQAKSMAAAAAEGVANVKSGGIPTGTVIRKILGDKAAKKWIEQTLEPGAGIEQ